MSTSTIMVTGATNGIGLAVARGLAEDGAEVVLVGRDPDKLAAARSGLPTNARTARADFTRLDDVRALATSVGHVDVVISNAATVAPIDAITVDGHQRTLQVNHLAAYLLLRLLTEGQDPPSRVVMVGADPVLLGRTPVDLDALDAPPEGAAGQSELVPFALYARTKNMTAMTMRSLAERAEGTLVCGAHPGIIGGTDLTKETPGLSAAITSAYVLDRSSLPGPDVGADTPRWLATTPDAQDGGFYVERRVAPLADHVTDPARRMALWERSAQLVGLHP